MRSLSIEVISSSYIVQIENWGLGLELEARS